MDLFLNVLILLFEILYYSLFMKFTKKDGKFWKYVIVFIINTILILIASSSKFPTYLIFVIATLFMLKYLVKVKTGLFDMLNILIMLFLKVLIETPLYFIFIGISNRYLVSIIVNIFKLVIIILLSNKLNKLYNILKVKWEKNNFYIRYLFSISAFIYCIVTIILFIFC